MSKAILRYKSDPKVYEIQCDDAPYREIINELSISEEFLINEKFKHISSALGDYQLITETEVNDTM